MPTNDHRPRVAAELRERMRMRLLTTAVRAGARKGPAALTIDDIVVGAEVSRGSFYKYFPSIEALLKDLATQIANELTSAAEPLVVRFEDPPGRELAARPLSQARKAAPWQAGQRRCNGAKPRHLA